MVRGYVEEEICGQCWEKIKELTQRLGHVYI